MATSNGDTTEMSDAEEVEVPAEKKRNIVLPIVAVVVLIALFFGGKYYMYLRAHQSTDDAQVSGDIVPVLARVGGYVKNVNVAENDTVKLGETVVVLDATDLEAKVAQAQADLTGAAAAAGGQASAQVSGATSQAQAFGAQLQGARANAEKAQRDLARIKELADKQIVPKQQLDAAQAAYETAQATVRSFEQQQAAATAGAQGARAGASVAQSKSAAMQAALDAAKLQLSYATVTSPAAGVVAKKSVIVGQLVQPGQPLLTVVSDTAVWVTANFKETQLKDIKPGAVVEIDVDSYPDCNAKGVVESIGAATGSQFSLLPADNASGNFTKVVQRIPVRIGVKEACGKDRPLRPGMSVTAHVNTK